MIRMRNGAAAGLLLAWLPLAADAAGNEAAPSSTVTAVSPSVPMLIERGDALLALGDFAGARLFYAEAARAGSARGATAVGATYDPIVHEKRGVQGAMANPVDAIRWYHAAAKAGDDEAGRRLDRLIRWLGVDAAAAADPARLQAAAAARFQALLETARAQRAATEEEARREAEAEAQRIAAEEEARREAEAEAQRIAAEEKARRQAEGEAQRIAAEEEARREAEAEAQRAAAEEARRLAEQAAQRAAAEEARRAAEAEAQRAAAEQARHRTEEEASRAATAETKAAERARQEAELRQRLAEEETARAVAETAATAAEIEDVPTGPAPAPHPLAEAPRASLAATSPALASPARETQGPEPEQPAEQQASVDAVGGASAASITGRLDAVTEYEMFERPNGFRLSVYHAPMQIIPDYEALEPACRDAVNRIAEKLAAERGRSAPPAAPPGIHMKIWRSTLDIRTRCLATATYDFGG